MATCLRTCVCVRVCVCVTTKSVCTRKRGPDKRIGKNNNVCVHSRERERERERESMQRVDRPHQRVTRSILPCIRPSSVKLPPGHDRWHGITTVRLKHPAPQRPAPDHTCLWLTSPSVSSSAAARFLLIAAEISSREAPTALSPTALSHPPNPVCAVLPPLSRCVAVSASPGNRVDEVISSAAVAGRAPGVSAGGSSRAVDVSVGNELALPPPVAILESLFTSNFNSESPCLETRVVSTVTTTTNAAKIEKRARVGVLGHDQWR